MILDDLRSDHLTAIFSATDRMSIEPASTARSSPRDLSREPLQLVCDPDPVADANALPSRMLHQMQGTGIRRMPALIRPPSRCSLDLATAIRGYRGQKTITLGGWGADTMGSARVA